MNNPRQTREQLEKVLKLPSPPKYIYKIDSKDLIYVFVKSTSECEDNTKYLKMGMPSLFL